MKFSPLQLSFVMVLFIGISGHVIIIPHILTVALRDSWICTFIAYVVLILWGMMICYTMSRMGNQKLFDWAKERAGALVSGIIVFLFFIYILFMGTTSFYDLIQSVKIYFLPNTPTFIVALCFLLLCLGASNGGLKTVVYFSVVLLPIVWILAIFVASATIKAQDYTYLFPVFIHGYVPILKGTAVMLSGNADLLVLLLLRHKLIKSYSMVHTLVLVTILVGLLMVLLLGSISSFGPNVAASLRFPALEQWRLATLGSYLTHLDFLAVFQLLAGTTIRVAFCFILLYDLLELCSKKMAQIGKYVTPALFFSTIFIKSDMWVLSFTETYVYPYLFIFAFFISIFLLAISFMPVRKGAKIT